MKPGRSSTRTELKTVQRRGAYVRAELLDDEELAVFAALSGADLNDDGLHALLRSTYLTVRAS